MAKSYSKLSETLKKLLYEKRLNPAQLAQQVKLPVPTIHRLVTGKTTRPYKSSLEPIADYFSISIDQLLGEKQIPDLGDRDNKSSDSGLSATIKKIPILEFGDNIDTNLEKDNARYVLSTGALSDKSFALVMPDSTMEPLFPKNSILIFDQLRAPKDRCYILAKLANQTIPVFRQLLIDVDNKYLKTINPDLDACKMYALDKKDLIVACLFESRISHETM
jgi:transcriptional regulator with XRE-family HTH domain